MITLASKILSNNYVMHQKHTGMLLNSNVKINMYLFIITIYYILSSSQNTHVNNN